MAASAVPFIGSAPVIAPAAPSRFHRTRFGFGGGKTNHLPVGAIRVVSASSASRAPPPRQVIGVDEHFDGTGKVVLVTGASGGIGFEASRQLVEAGCKVLMAARSLDKAEASVNALTTTAVLGGGGGGGGGGGSAEAVVFDLADLNSIRTWAREYVASGRPLSAIVCNAGVAPDREGAPGVSAVAARVRRDVFNDAPAVQRTTQGFEQTIGVNHLGHFALVASLMPSLRATPNARVVVTSGDIHNAESPDGKNGSPPTLGGLEGLLSGPHFTMCDGGAYDGNKAYKDSKLCGVLFAREMARRLDELSDKDGFAGDGGRGLVCNAFSPGFVPSSALFRNQSGAVQALLKYGFNFPPLATSLRTAGLFTTHMVLGVETGRSNGLYYCGAPDFYKEGESQGMGFLRGIFRPEFAAKQPSVEARDRYVARRLWELSEELVGVSFTLTADADADADEADAPATNVPSPALPPR